MPSEPWEEIARRCEEASGQDRELGVRLIALALAPAGATVEQSRINGRWCIYDGVDRSGWPRGWSHTLQRLRERDDDVTESTDAILALIGEKLPGWDFELEICSRGKSLASATLMDDPQCRKGVPVPWLMATTPALALCAAFARAMAAQARAEEG